MSEATLAWPLEHAARVHGDRAAVIDDTATLTYAQLHERVRRLAGALEIPRGGIAGVLAGNTREHLELWFTLPAYGRVINDLNHRLAPDELAFMLTHSETSVLYHDAARAELAHELKARTGVRLVALEELPEGDPIDPPDLPGDTLAESPGIRRRRTCPSRQE